MTHSPHPSFPGPRGVSAQTTPPDASVRTDGSLPLDFPGGLPGYPGHRRFRLEPIGEAACWLQGLDEGAPTFLVVDPFRTCPDLDLRLPAGLPQLVKANDDSSLRILAIVTLPRSPESPPTMNLQGLLLINPDLGVGRQVIVPDSGYGVRTAVRLHPAA
ncbi:MAG: flagellar assembly protein FliW [Gemmatimonadales bacterium]|nr:MAG: flagellar assembly protein FliW [Gemmatimonadales bacterium]